MLPEDTTDCVIFLVAVYILIIIILDPLYFKWSLVKIMTWLVEGSGEDEPARYPRPRPSPKTSKTQVKFSTNAPKRKRRAQSLTRKRSKSKVSKPPSHHHRRGPKKGMPVYREVKVMEPIDEEWEVWRRGDKY